MCGRLRLSGLGVGDLIPRGFTWISGGSMALAQTCSVELQVFIPLSVCLSTLCIAIGSS